MAEGSDLERSEAPTPKRLAEARADGKVARSQELMIAASFLGGAAILSQMGPALGQRMAELFTDTLTVAGSMDLTIGSATQLMRQTGGRAFLALIGVMVAMASAPLAIATLQAKGTLSLEPLMPKFDRTNPINNIKNMIGSRQLTDLLNALAKLAIVGVSVYVALQKAIPDAVVLAQKDPRAVATVVLTYVVKLLTTAGVAYVSLAGADYLWQWWQFQKQMRMTKDEVRLEHKQTDGDPNIKARRRSIARNYARRQMMRDVAKADVVITNPTHIAVAIKYDPSLAPAPIVLAIGQNKVAERMKEIAREAGIPMVENRPIARALLKTARVGTLIPVELYIAVAEILAFVLRTRGTRGGWPGSKLA